MSDRISRKAQKRSLVLMARDIEALVQLYLHRTISSSQLASLCFPDISYETARKRLRRLQQAGFTGSTSSGRMEGRGRPELIYFLSGIGARALEQYRGISWETIPTGPPHVYHREHFLRLVDLRLAMEAAERQGIITQLGWITGREFWKELIEDSDDRAKSAIADGGGGLDKGSGAVSLATADASVSDPGADAIVSFQYPESAAIKVLLEIDTGNFRQTKHWEPKIKSFLQAGFPIWVVTGNPTRILTLRKWTAPLLQAAGVGPGKCVFALYSEIMEKGVFGASWVRTDGTITNLRPKSGA